ncbi:MAG: DUF484 family protein [Halomonas sp.]|nr:DUF484 family protein [Halomonas sp.]
MSQAPEPRKTLDPDQVAFWLARHPDFFVGREGLLQQLQVPHPHIEGAVSLLERLVIDLRQRAETAEGRLEHLWCPASLSDAEPALPQPPRHVLDQHASARLAALLDGRTSRCAKLSVSDWKCLLPHVKAPRKAGSCAISRLSAGEPMGYLLIASPDADQYRASMDTLFTEYLGDIVARLLLRLTPHE